MRYWKRIDSDEDSKFVYVESSEIDYLMHKLLELHRRRNELNEEYYVKTVNQFLDRLEKEIRG